jgi:hypothetical protein
MEFAERRLSEMRVLGQLGHQVPTSLLDDWLRNQRVAWVELRRLPLDQRQLLAELLLGSAALDARGSLAGAVPGDALLAAQARSDAWVDGVRVSLGGPVAQTDVVAPSSGRPLAIPRPLPQEEPDRDVSNETGAPAPKPQPAAPVAAPPPAEPDPSAQMSAPIIRPPAEDEDDDEGSCGEPPAVGEAPPTGGDDAPPPPPMGGPPLATATPESPAPNEGGTSEPSP